jgi:hypothetical protein
LTHPSKWIKFRAGKEIMIDNNFKKFNILFAFGLLAGAPFLMLGCGKEMTMTPMHELAAAVAVAEELNGTWVDACQAESSHSHQSTYIFNENLWKLVIVTYSDSKCSNPSIEYISGGSFSKRNAAIPAIGNAKEIDFTVTSYTVTPYDDQELAGVHEAGFPGVFAVGKTTNISNQTHNVLYQIYALTGSTLQLGDLSDEADGTTPARRPKVLKSAIFTKQ